MSTLDAAFDQLPEAIRAKLSSMIQRVRRLLLIRGLCATIAVALASLLGIMAIDAMITLFTPASRWALSLAGLGCTCTAAWWFLFRPLSRRFTLAEMARIIEERHPELQERVSTAVELLSSDDPDSIKGSNELIGVVVDSAIVDVKTVDPHTEFNPEKSVKFMGAAAGFAAVILITLAIWPTQSWTLLKRALAPFLNTDNAFASTLVIDPGDVKVIQGEPVTITLTVDQPRVKRAEIRRLLEDGTESIERLMPSSNGETNQRKFSITFPSVEKDFSYRIRAGSALSQYYEITTVVPPSLENLSVHYDYPDYTGLEDRKVQSPEGEIRAVAHTMVTVSAVPKSPIAEAIMRINKTTTAERISDGEETLAWRFQLAPSMQGFWNLELTDEDGFSNPDSPFPLESLPDKAPTVQLQQPVQKELRLRPTEKISLISNITEDFGIAAVSLLIRPSGNHTPWEQELDLPDSSARTNEYTSNGVLDLTTIPAETGQTRVEVRVVARDSRPSDYEGPGIGMSDPLTIIIDPNAKSLAEQAVEAKQRHVEQRLQEARQELERARNEMKRVEQEVRRTDEFSERARRPLEQFSKHASEARDRLDQVAEALDDSFLQEQADQARAISNEEIAKATELGDLISVTDSKADRQNQSREATRDIEEAIKKVQSIQEAMKDAREEFRMISELNELASQQEQLALNSEEWAEESRKRAAELTKDARDFTKQKFAEQEKRSLEEFLREQQRVQQQLGEMLQEDIEALEEVLQGQQQHATAMADRAQQLAEEQQSLADLSDQVLGAESQLQEALREQLIEYLRQRQEALATEAASLAQPANPSDETNQPSKAHTDASQESLEQGSQRASEAADQLADRALKEAAEQSSLAGERFAEASRSAEHPSSQETGSDSQETREASQNPSLGAAPSARLADEQQKLAEQIAMVRDGDLQEALQAMEEQLKSEASELSQDAQALEKSLENLSQNAARTSADQADRSLKRGASEAGQAANQLNEANRQQELAESRQATEAGELSQPAQAAMQRAQQDQQASATALSQASQALGNSSQALAQTLQGMSPSESESSSLTSSEEMAEGFEEVSESSRSQDASEAAQQSREAANSLQKLAQSAMQKLGQTGSDPNLANMPPGSEEAMAENPDSISLNKSGEKTTDTDGSGVPPGLREMGVSEEDWARFRGAISGGNAAEIESELPPEYRELVGRYFQVITKEAGKNP
ncbi:MAG: hypothetical protein AAGA96_12955 [Verrucomicrobiota bacterium]